MSLGSMEWIAEVESSSGSVCGPGASKSYPAHLEAQGGEGSGRGPNSRSLHSAHAPAFQLPELTGLTAPDEKDMAAVLSPDGRPLHAGQRADRLRRPHGSERDILERKDGIWEGLDVTTSTQAAVLYDCRCAVASMIGLPKESIRNLPQTKDAAGVWRRPCGN